MGGWVMSGPRGNACHAAPGSDPVVASPNRPGTRGVGTRRGGLARPLAHHPGEATHNPKYTCRVKHQPGSAPFTGSEPAVPARTSVSGGPAHQGSSADPCLRAAPRPAAPLGHDHRPRTPHGSGSGNARITAVVVCPAALVNSSRRGRSAGVTSRARRRSRARGLGRRSCGAADRSGRAVRRGAGPSPCRSRSHPGRRRTPRACWA